MIRTRWSAALAATLVAVTASAARAEPLVLTSCSAVPPHTTAVLQDDLACGYHCANDPGEACDPAVQGGGCSEPSFCEPDSIALGDGSRLLLGGHTLHLAYQGDGAVCGELGDSGRCSVIGPGHIAGDKGIAVWGRSMDVVVRNVTISRCDGGVLTDGKLYATNVVLAPDRENGLYSGRDMHLVNVVIDGDRDAVSEEDVFVRNVVLGKSGIVAAGRVRGEGVRLEGSGVSARDVSLRRVIGVPGEGYDGPGTILAEQGLRLADSIVVGNEEGDDRPDLVSGRRPVLARTTCGRSARFGDPDASWHVCRGERRR